MSNPKLITTTVLTLGIVLTAWILGSSFKNRNANLDTISVTGLGTKDFISDEIRWSGDFGTHAEDAKTAYSIIKADKEKVKNFFISKGFKEDEFYFGGVNFSKAYRSIRLEQDGRYTRTETIPNGYNARQRVVFTSKKNKALMKKIENVIDETADLVNLGIEFNPDRVQYTYSDLPSLKHNLIESASKDAYERAAKISKKSKGDIGKLKKARMGVFQITGKGSNEEDSYGGNFDVYHKNKTARITVRLEYQLD